MKSTNIIKRDSYVTQNRNSIHLSWTKKLANLILRHESSWEKEGEKGRGMIKYRQVLIESVQIFFTLVVRGIIVNPVHAWNLYKDTRDRKWRPRSRLADNQVTVCRDTKVLLMVAIIVVIAAVIRVGHYSRASSGGGTVKEPRPTRRP